MTDLKLNEPDGSDAHKPFRLSWLHWAIIGILFLALCKDLEQKARIAIYKRAAERGSATSQTWLGYHYERGDGVSRDASEALRYYRMAADQGDPLAEYDAGVMYRDGKGAPADIKEARDWFRKSADQGFPPSMYNLGLLYRVGVGVPRDIAEAYKWIALAARAGYPRAQADLANMERLISKDELAEGRRRLAAAHIGQEGNTVRYDSTSD
jgi:TPR repeat protein